MKDFMQRWFPWLRVTDSTPALLASEETVITSQDDPPVLSILFNTLWHSSLESEAEMR